MVYDKGRFAGNLRAQRARLRLSQEQLSKLSGVAPQSIKNYENEENTPSVDAACRLASALGISLNELVGFEVED